MDNHDKSFDYLLTNMESSAGTNEVFDVQEA
jgi:hypothetical protein